MIEDALKQSHKYRWAWWAIFLNFSNSFLMLPLLTILNGMFGFFLYYVIKDEITLGFILFALFSPFILFFIIAWFWLLLFPIGRLLLSYFIVSPHGIEYRYWPTYGVRCKWSDVERLGKFKSLGLFAYDVLYLKHGEPIGKPITMKLRSKLGLKTQYFVALTGIHGWPQGRLKDDLQKYAPQLFEGAALNEKSPHSSESAG